MMRVFAFIILLFPFTQVYTQTNSTFCKAIEKENFNRAVRIFKKEVRKHKNGSKFDNGPGSGIQTTHVGSLDTLTTWLKNQYCVEDAYWDRCQAKIAIYPGWSSIGVKFKTRKGICEKCFFIQEGTLGCFKIFKWRIHIFKPRSILVYKKMYDCAGFIDQQKHECTQSHILSRLNQNPDDSIHYQRNRVPVDSLLGKWVNSINPADTLEFINSIDSPNILMMPSLLDTHSRIQNTYYFRIVKPGYVQEMGGSERWKGVTCLAGISKEGDLEILYSNCRDEKAGTPNYCLKIYHRVDH